MAHLFCKEVRSKSGRIADFTGIYQANLRLGIRATAYLRRLIPPEDFLSLRHGKADMAQPSLEIARGALPE